MDQQLKFNFEMGKRRRKKRTLRSAFKGLKKYPHYVAGCVQRVILIIYLYSFLIPTEDFLLNAIKVIKFTNNGHEFFLLTSIKSLRFQ